MRISAIVPLLDKPFISSRSTTHRTPDLQTATAEMPKFNAQHDISNRLSGSLGHVERYEISSIVRRGP
ncbi:Protein-glutamate methylesterase/protein-glutamine glutaminase [Dirofilaria immitis]